jgi:hypothetical protein
VLRNISNNYRKNQIKPVFLRTKTKETRYSAFFIFARIDPINITLFIIFLISLMPLLKIIYEHTIRKPMQVEDRIIYKPNNLLRFH